eukprot:scaffold278330_cov28-Tisochrysis_lutea.AAC.3
MSDVGLRLSHESKNSLLFTLLPACSNTSGTWSRRAVCDVRVQRRFPAATQRLIHAARVIVIGGGRRFVGIHK